MSTTPSNQSRGPCSPEDAVIVGKVTGAWGLDGHIKVEPFTDLAERFSPGSHLLLAGKVVKVVQASRAKAGLRVRLDSVTDRTHAESLRGALLTVPRSAVKPLPKGTYYHFQIIDIAVWTEDGEHLGEVKEILAAGGADVYVVRGGSRGEVLLSAVPDVVLEVDPAENRMVVRLPEGLA